MLFIIDINTRLPMHIEIFDGELEYMEPVVKEKKPDEAKNESEETEADAQNGAVAQDEAASDEEAQAPSEGTATPAE